MGVSKLTLAAIDQRSVPSGEWLHVHMRADVEPGGPDGRPVDQWGD